MADHVRKQIRAAAAVALAGLATTGARVYVSRVYPLQDAELPAGAGALRIYARDESVTVSSMGVGRVRERTLGLVVEACVKAVSGYDDLADQIQKEVEIAFDADQGLGGLAKYVELRSVEDAFEGEAEKPVAVKRMTFEVLYYTAQGAPDAAL